MVLPQPSEWVQLSRPAELDIDVELTADVELSAEVKLDADIEPDALQPSCSPQQSAPPTSQLPPAVTSATSGLNYSGYSLAHVKIYRNTMGERNMRGTMDK